MNTGAAGPGAQASQVIVGNGQVTGFALAFTTDLDVRRAQDVRNYRVVSAGRDRRLRTCDDRRVRVAARRMTRRCGR